MRKSPLAEILDLQRSWANSLGKHVAENGYVASVTENLWKPLSPEAMAAFEDGKGSELRDSERGPAKMRALRSSSALCVNVFDYWSGRDCRPLMTALGLEQADDILRFEARYPTKLSLTNTTNSPPHLDVAIRLCSGVTAGVESKFTEWLDRRQPEVDKPQQKKSFPKYLADGRVLWAEEDLPHCQSLVESIDAGTEHFTHLNAPQLLKHALGLGTQCGRQFSLYYLYYDWPCAQAFIHRDEIARFDANVGAEIRFVALTYQELFKRISEGASDADNAYLGYLGRRYFFGHHPAIFG
ncbi:hypothetical protein SAMN05192539_106127 [Paraburkholderia diazotrophica]|uniref:Uncharacterized protein n=2 Tax=Paraburkholderia diazotrophica TaxID=667676 RepID=A0A1H7EG42_9BURK|nr:hypothetical protein SAMN05192539_106127 [Paraburkholderia diazotrophica]